MRATWTWDDRALRRDLSELLADVMATGHLNARAFRRMQAGVAPGPEMSVAKLMYAQNLTRAAHFVSRVLGPRIIADTGEWGTYAWTELLLATPALRILGGTEEIMKNILAERVLGLPKEPGIDTTSPFRELPRSGGTVMNEGKEELDELREAVREFLAAKSAESAVRAAMESGGRRYDPAVWDQLARQLRLPGLALPERVRRRRVRPDRARGRAGGDGGRAAVLALLRHGRARRPGAARLGRRGGLRAVPARHRRRTDHRHARRRRRQRLLGPGHGLGPGRAHGDGGWALTGQKSFVIDGATADLVLVVARSTAGPALFAVDRGAPGTRAPSR